MSTSISVNQLSNGRVVPDISAKGTLYQFAPRLDELCTSLEVRRLSDYLDLTDAASNLTGENASHDPEKARERMARSGKWFRPESGVATLQALLEHLRRNPTRFGLVANRYKQVIADLEGSLESIRKAQETGAKFHLSVVL